ncbi:MAG: LemA family protein [Muribaculaceae bacterium]|nr:LemA family protein [Muribaculaceae bacterium]MDE6094365.1 LemA family protein [Muribaculaceae bacterium]
MTLWIVLGVIAVLAIWGFSSYNSMVSQEENVDKTWANVQNQYQRRSDLIPNLVATVKGYSEHESSTLENVTAARAGLLQAKDEADGIADPQDNIAAFQKAQSKLQSAMGFYINAVREAYPDLKANENFMNLQTQLEGTENRIATERTRYNDAVQSYNVSIRRFPAVIVASIAGFDKKDPFAADEAAQTAPKVQF